MIKSRSGDKLKKFIRPKGGDDLAIWRARARACGYFCTKRPFLHSALLGAQRVAREHLRSSARSCALPQCEFAQHQPSFISLDCRRWSAATGQMQRARKSYRRERVVKPARSLFSRCEIDLANLLAFCLPSLSLRLSSGAGAHLAAHRPWLATVAAAYYNGRRVGLPGRADRAGRQANIACCSCSNLNLAGLLYSRPI